MKQISEKEKENKAKLNKVYEEFNAITPKFCFGCGHNNMLSHSHIIPRSRRKDLEADIDNIRYHCLERSDGSLGCHQRFESMNWELMTSMIDFQENLKYIKLKDLLYFNTILSKIGGKECIKCKDLLSLEKFKFRKDTNNYRGECNICRKKYIDKYNEGRVDERKIYMKIYNKSKSNPINYGKKTLEQVKEIFQNLYEYKNWVENYKGIHEKQKIICKIHGKFERTPHEMVYKHLGCYSCLTNKIEGEELLKSILDGENIKYNREESFFYSENFPTCRNPKTNSPLYFDFYLPDYNLLIEIDEGHHLYCKNTKNRDLIKNKFCDENRINLIRIPYKTIEDKKLFVDRFYNIFNKIN